MEKIIKKNINLILTFFIMISIILATIFNTIYINLKKETLLSWFDEMDIYRQVYEEIQSELDNYIYQSGLEINTLRNICDEERIKTDFINIVNTLYDGREYKIDTYSIKLNLDKEIKEYINSNGRKINSEEQENIDKFENLIADSYGKSISSYINFKDTLHTSLNNFINRCKLLRNIFIIVAIVLTVFLFKMSNDNIYIKIGFIGVSFFASGFILIKAKNTIYSNIDINNLIVLTKALSNIIIYIATEMIDTINKAGKYFILIGLFLIVITAILGLDADTKNRIKRRKVSENEED